MCCSACDNEDQIYGLGDLIVLLKDFIVFSLLWRPLGGATSNERIVQRLLEGALLMVRRVFSLMMSLYKTVLLESLMYMTKKE